MRAFGVIAYVLFQSSPVSDGKIFVKQGVIVLITEIINALNTRVVCTSI